MDAELSNIIDDLRRQLHEKDQEIASLRMQLSSYPLLPRTPAQEEFEDMVDQ